MRHINVTKYLWDIDSGAGDKQCDDKTRCRYLWLKVVRPMVADTNATAKEKVVFPHRRRVNTLDTPMEKNWQRERMQTIKSRRREDICTLSGTKSQIRTNKEQTNRIRRGPWGIVPAWTSSLRRYHSLWRWTQHLVTHPIQSLKSFWYLLLISPTLTDEVVRKAATEEGRGNGHQPGNDIKHPTLMEKIYIFNRSE